MNKKQFKNLSTGDIVTNLADPYKTYIVTVNYGGRITAVRTADMTNPDEWCLKAKSAYKYKRK